MDLTIKRTGFAFSLHESPFTETDFS